MHEVMGLSPDLQKKLCINYTRARYSMWKTENKGEKWPLVPPVITAANILFMFF